MAVTWKKIAFANQPLDDFGATSDNTRLDFSTTAHGLVPKGTNTGDFLKDDGTWAAAGGATAAAALFGDGSDGDVTIAGDTSLSRDMLYDNLTIDATKRLDTQGFRVFIKGILTNNGTISNNGGDGSIGGASVGAKGVGAGKASSTPNGGDGGDGKDTPENGDTAENLTNSIYAAGVGGRGGDGSLNSGGNGETPSANVLGSNFKTSISITSYVGATLLSVSGGGGGGSGGAGALAGGGGGGGGGITFIASKEIDNNGVIECNGGSGGNGAIGDNCGGGGGGAGGLVVLIYNTAAWTTEQALGGAAGTGSGTGDNGVAGASGAVIKLSN